MAEYCWPSGKIGRVRNCIKWLLLNKPYLQNFSFIKWILYQKRFQNTYVVNLQITDLISIFSLQNSYARICRFKSVKNYNYYYFSFLASFKTVISINYPKPAVLNLGHAYHQGFMRSSQGVRKILKPNHKKLIWVEYLIWGYAKDIQLGYGGTQVAKGWEPLS